MQIDDMPAGRELDALVAEKVMGWRITAWNDGEPWGNREVFPPFEPINGIPADCDCISHSEAGEPPHYSTDIAAAWEVFQKVTDLGYIPAIAQCTSGWACDFWTEEAADETGRVDYIHKFREYGQVSAPLAICRAALKVVGA